MDDTWFSRDLPVLDTAVELTEQTKGWPVPDRAIAEATGFEIEEVRRSLETLRHFFTVVNENDHQGVTQVGQPLPEARVAVGQWPSPENMAERIVAELEQRAEAEPDEQKRGLIKKVVAGVGQTGREIFVDVMAQVIAKQTGAA